MYLTLWRMARSRGPPKYYKRAMYRRMAWSFLGRKRNCYAISLRSVHRALQHGNKARSVKKQSMKMLWAQRISAACREHGTYYQQFRAALAESNIALNNKVLADLAVYEPRTFQSLCELSKQRWGERGVQAATLERPSGVFTRGML